VSRVLSLIVVCAALLAGHLIVTPTAFAQGREAPAARISLDQATNMVRRRTKGKVISARTQRNGSRVVHRVKVLDNGKVRTYSVDASSGAMR